MRIQPLSLPASQHLLLLLAQSTAMSVLINADPSSIHHPDLLFFGV